MRSQRQYIASMDDGKLVESFRQGNDFALNELLKRHEPVAEEMISAVLHDYDEVQDAMQETRIAVSQGIRRGHYTEQDSFEKWIKTIAWHCATGAARQKSRYTSLKGMDPPAEPETKGSDCLDDRILIIRQIISAMDARTQQVIKLRTEEYFGFKKIGSLLKISPDLARLIFWRAMRKIKRLFDNRQAAEKFFKKYFSKSVTKQRSRALV